MIRKIIKIDQEQCNGCGLCAEACHEGAIGMINGKAVLLRDDYCDGLGNCLPVCPTGAITFEEREALSFNEAEVQKNTRPYQATSAPLPCGCPGTNVLAFPRKETGTAQATAQKTQAITSELAQWPVQIKLVPLNAPYFDKANLLIAADCAAYAYGNFHNEFMRGRITLIGCPKLDEGDYCEKLAAILRSNNIQSITVARMEVPCCGGIELAAKTALQYSGKKIPWQVITITTDGCLL